MKPADLFIAVRLAAISGLIGGIAVMLLSKRPQALPKIA